jgi:pyruvate carboxylase
MKLGLADQTAPRPPAILVLGEGALALQIRDDLISLGLYTLMVSDLGLDPNDSELPRVTDLDAAVRFREIFNRFRQRDEVEPFDHIWVHPGVTLWGERPELEGWARQSGLFAITSSAKNLQLFWNMHQALDLAKSIGVPTLVVSDEPVTSVREIEASIRKLGEEGRAGFPLVMKSAYRVRGGYATRVLRNLDELNEWVPIWMNQVQEACGATLLFFERFLESARCYVQPFARRKDGHVEFFPVIDGSLMFEGKNWVEVCPAQTLDDEIRGKIEDYSRRFLNASEFVGVGNLVFLSNGIDAFFTEALGRINFGYRLWESVARTKAVQWQIHILAPALLASHPEVNGSGRAPDSGICGINLKLYAEDTWLKIPHPGMVHEVSFKTEWNEGDFEGSLVWDVVPGQNVDWKSSGALGQVTLFSTSWSKALKCARKILSEIWISGSIQTNERFLFELLSHPWVEESMFYTGFVDDEFIPKQAPESVWLKYISEALAEVTPLLKTDEGFLWMNHRLPAPEKQLSWTQRVEFWGGFHKGVKGFFLSESGKLERICVYPIHDRRFVVRIQNWFFSVRRSEKGRPLQLMALTSGRIHSIFYKENSVVPSRQTIVILESHQNLISHRLPVPVKIKKLKVRAEDEVLAGQELAEIERWIEKEGE